MLKAIFFFTAVVFAISFATSTSSPAFASGGVKGDWVVTFTIAGQTVDGSNGTEFHWTLTARPSMAPSIQSTLAKA